VEEAVVSELVDHFEQEKTCSVDPAASPAIIAPCAARAAFDGIDNFNGKAALRRPFLILKVSNKPTYLVGVGALIRTQAVLNRSSVPAWLLLPP